MRRAPGISRFLAAPAGTKLMALEAAFELILARLNTLRSARKFTGALGQHEGQPIAADDQQQERAASIGHVVELTARVMPFRAVCLQQAIALRRMLRRRDIPATIYLGVLPDTGQAASGGAIAGDHLPMAAHAWVKSGDRIVNGKVAGLNRYVVLGVFS